MHKFMNLELVKGSGWHSLLTEQFIIRKTRGGKRGKERSRAKAELGKYKTEGQPDRQTAIRWQSPQVSDRKSSGFWRQKLHCLPYPGVYTLPIYPSLSTSLTLPPSLSLASTVTSDDVRGIYCLPKAPRQTEESEEEEEWQRQREDDEDDDKCGRGSAILTENKSKQIVGVQSRM